MQKPNFLLIVTDQQRADSLGCYGGVNGDTKNIDSLARAGFKFDRCYVAAPVCMPNRASLMTGRMPSRHRTRMNGIPLSLHENTFVEQLRRAGYRTALIGKSHLQTMEDIVARVSAGPNARKTLVQNEAVLRAPSDDYEQEMPWRFQPGEPGRTEPYYGFDEVVLCTGHGDMAGGDYRVWAESQVSDFERLVGPSNALPHDLVCPQAWRTAVPEDLYPTRFVESAAIEQLRAWAHDDSDPPFFLTMSFPDPHHPFTPPGRYWDLYKPNDMVLPSSFNQGDDTLPQVAWARKERKKNPGVIEGYGVFSVSEQECREAIALTCGQLSMIDDSIGHVLRELNRLGLERNTVVIFTSDHGDLLGDYGLLLKGPIHTQSIVRVPLIWSDPHSSAQGVSADSLCSTIDISTTILARAGVAPYNGMQGTSLLGVMEGLPAPRDAVLIEEDAYQAQLGFDIPPRVRSLITDRYRITLYGSGHRELFDLKNDQDELHNIWDSPRSAAVRAELLERLSFAMLEAADTSPSPRYLA